MKAKDILSANILLAACAMLAVGSIYDEKVRFFRNSFFSYFEFFILLVVLF